MDSDEVFDMVLAWYDSGTLVENLEYLIERDTYGSIMCIGCENINLVQLIYSMCKHKSNIDRIMNVGFLQSCIKSQYKTAEWIYDLSVEESINVIKRKFQARSRKFNDQVITCNDFRYFSIIDQLEQAKFVHRLTLREGKIEDDINFTNIALACKYSEAKTIDVIEWMWGEVKKNSLDVDLWENYDLIYNNAVVHKDTKISEFLIREYPEHYLMVNGSYCHNSVQHLFKQHADKFNSQEGIFDFLAVVCKVTVADMKRISNEKLDGIVEQICPNCLEKVVDVNIYVNLVCDHNICGKCYVSVQKCPFNCSKCTMRKCGIIVVGNFTDELITRYLGKEALSLVDDDSPDTFVPLSA